MRSWPGRVVEMARSVWPALSSIMFYPARGTSGVPREPRREAEDSSGCGTSSQEAEQQATPQEPKAMEEDAETAAAQPGGCDGRSHHDVSVLQLACPRERAKYCYFYTWLLSSHFIRTPHTVSLPHPRTLIPAVGTR